MGRNTNSRAEFPYMTTVQITKLANKLTLLWGDYVSSEIQSFSVDKFQIQKEVKMDRVVDTESSDQLLLSLDL